MVREWVLRGMKILLGKFKGYENIRRKIKGCENIERKNKGCENIRRKKIRGTKKGVRGAKIF